MHSSGSKTPKEPNKDKGKKHRHHHHHKKHSAANPKKLKRLSFDVSVIPERDEPEMEPCDEPYDARYEAVDHRGVSFSVGEMVEMHEMDTLSDDDPLDSTVIDLPDEPSESTPGGAENLPLFDKPQTPGDPKNTKRF